MKALLAFKKKSNGKKFSAHITDENVESLITLKKKAFKDISSRPFIQVIPVSKT